MAGSSIPVPGGLSGTGERTRPEAFGGTWLERLHSWVITVDHKKLGILYILYALGFMVIAGVEALMIRAQLFFPDNHLIGPETYNRIFTMHGTTMIFFVAMPLVFGFGNYLMPLMLGVRDMAFPRLNAFSFWMSAFGGLLLYYSFIGGVGLQGAGSAPDVGWFAYAPLTARAFSRGHSTDYWAIALTVSGFGSIGAAINFIATAFCMRCKGMTLFRMPLFVWLYVVTSGLVILAVSPLTAAQVMLLIDRYLGGHFFDTQAGGSALVWVHFFWIFGHPEVYVLVLPAFAIANEIIPVFSRKAIFGYPAMVASVGGHRLRESGRVGAPHVHGGDDVDLKCFLHALDDAGRHPDRHQDIQLGRDDVGRQDPLCGPHAVLGRLPGAVPHRRTDRDHAVGLPVRLAIAQLVLRGRALPLRDRGRHPVHDLCGHLLLVPQGNRSHDGRAARQVALLALPAGLSSHLRLHAHPRHPRDAAPDLHLWRRSRLDWLEPDCECGWRGAGDRHLHLRLQHDPFMLQGPRSRVRSLGCVDAGVGHLLSTPRL